MILLSYLAAHWTLVLLVTVAILGLSAASWFLKNWKLAAAAIVILFAGLAYQAVDMEGYKRRLAEDNLVQVQMLQRRLGALQLTQALDAQRAVADSYLNSKLDDLSRATPRNDGACLDLPAARRVRAISSAKPLATPLPTGRLTSLLQRRSSAP